MNDKGSARAPGFIPETKVDLFDYIKMFYNRTRRHSHLGGVSPEAFEQASRSGS